MSRKSKKSQACDVNCSQKGRSGFAVPCSDRASAFQPVEHPFDMDSLLVEAFVVSPHSVAVASAGNDGSHSLGANGVNKAT